MRAAPDKAAVFCKCISIGYFAADIADKFAHTAPYISAQNNLAVQNHMNVVDRDSQVRRILFPKADRLWLFLL